MSQTYIAQIVVVIALVLPRIFPGFVFSNDDLTALVQALFVAGGIIWTLVRRHQQGDITIAGILKG